MFTITLGKKVADGKLVLLNDGSASTQREQIIDLDNLDTPNATYSNVYVVDAVLGVVEARDLNFTPPFGRRLEIKANDKTQTAGAALAATVTITGFTDGDTITDLGGTLAFEVTDEDNAAVANVTAATPGTYKVMPKGLTSDKYYLSFIAGTLTITEVPKIPLTVTVDDVAIEYGASTPEFSVQFAGFDEGDDSTDLGGTLVYTVKDSQGETVADLTTAASGEYDIIASGLTSEKYNLSFVAGTLTVTKKALTLTVTDAEMVYGASAPAFAFAGAGYITGEDATDLGGSAVYTAKNSQGETVADLTTAATGEYEVHLSGVTAANYELTMVAGTLTVTKKALTLTVTDAEMVEGGDAPAFSFTGTGFVNDEDATALGGSAVYTVKDELGETVADLTAAVPGEYEVHLSGVTAANYELTMVAGTLTITDNGT